jgi:hypothetical protein
VTFEERPERGEEMIDRVICRKFVSSRGKSKGSEVEAC